MENAKMLVDLLNTLWEEYVAHSDFAERIEYFKSLSKDKANEIKNNTCKTLARPMDELSYNLCTLKTFIDYTIVMYFKIVIMMYENESITKEDAINIIKPKKADYIDGAFSLYLEKFHKNILDKIQDIMK